MFHRCRTAHLPASPRRVAGVFSTSVGTERGELRVKTARAGHYSKLRIVRSVAVEYHVAMLQRVRKPFLERSFVQQPDTCQRP